MAYLQPARHLAKMLDESGDPKQVKQFDLEGWFAHRVREKPPELGGKAQRACGATLKAYAPSSSSAHARKEDWLHDGQP